ncbi:CBS domain-containing protein [Devosia sp. SL43]|uniref:CBS domain-containing protein n=1 Tax=Devosia sp. SL43 TaxID=2806348 RepID=UPI001F40EC29|nr:CBS domain-containing protein [Devosia sp. SL43]UJW85655.1 CBS domain-containing protein [Devosia sp. SL43]
MKAKDVMSPHVVTLSPGNSVAHAAQIMLDNSVSGLPVIDNDGELVGVVTEGDLVNRMELGHPAADDLSTPEATDDFIKSHSWRVADIMSQPVVTVNEETTVEEIASIFSSRKIKRVPVTREGQLVGMVSRSDLLGIIARSKPSPIADGDEALCRSIAARLRTILHVSISPTVTVVDGTVHLGGTIRDENERRAIRVIVDGVPGAGRIQDHMRLDKPELAQG